MRDFRTNLIGTSGLAAMEDGAYGKAANQFYTALLADENNRAAWEGLAFAFHFMRAEKEVRTALARYALSGAGYSDELAAMACHTFQNDVDTLLQWLLLVSRKKGATPAEKQKLTGLVSQIRAIVRESASSSPRHDEERLTLEAQADQSISLDILKDMLPDEAVQYVAGWANHPAMAASAIEILACLPEPKSETLLRRICRNPEVAPSVKTGALLAMRWIGLKGNVRLSKFGRDYIVSLDHPEPELDAALPADFKTVYDWVGLWIMWKKGEISEQQFAAYTEEGIPEERLNQADIAGLRADLNIIDFILRQTFLHYYPELPAVPPEERRIWGAALLDLLRELAESSAPLAYQTPGLDAAAQARKSWLLAAMPDFDKAKLPDRP